MQLISINIWLTVIAEVSVSVNGEFLKYLFEKKNQMAFVS